MAEQTLKYNNAEELKKEIEGLKVKLKELQKKEKSELLDKRKNDIKLGQKVWLTFDGKYESGIVDTISREGRVRILFDNLKTKEGKQKATSRLVNNIDLKDMKKKSV